MKKLPLSLIVCSAVLLVLWSCASKTSAPSIAQNRVNEVEVMDSFIADLKQTDLLKGADPKITDAIRYYESLSAADKQKYLDSKSDFDVEVVARKAMEKVHAELEPKRKEAFRAEIGGAQQESSKGVGDKTSGVKETSTSGASTEENVAILDSLINNGKKFGLMNDLRPQTTEAIRHYEGLSPLEKRRYLETEFRANADNGFERAMRETKELQHEAARGMELRGEMRERQARGAGDRSGRARTNTEAVPSAKQFDLVLRNR